MKCPCFADFRLLPDRGKQIGLFLHLLRIAGIYIKCYLIFQGDRREFLFSPPQEVSLFGKGLNLTELLSISLGTMYDFA